MVYGNEQIGGRAVSDVRIPFIEVIIPPILITDDVIDRNPVILGAIRNKTGINIKASIKGVASGVSLIRAGDRWINEDGSYYINEDGSYYIIE